ncbi:MAG: hypothetical protein WC071_09760 [Victivallaceae bacterium]
MSGDMSFGVYWSVGAVLFALGILPMLDFSRWWSIAGYIVGMVASIPVRAIISKLFCVPYQPKLTGFQKFSRKTEE